MDPSHARALFLAEHDVPCPRCRYNLRGVTGSACPECGRAIMLVLYTEKPQRRVRQLLMLIFAILFSVGFLGVWSQWRDIASAQERTVRAVASDLAMARNKVIDLEAKRERALQAFKEADTDDNTVALKVINLQLNNRLLEHKQLEVYERAAREQFTMASTFRSWWWMVLRQTWPDGLLAIGCGLSLAVLALLLMVPTIAEQGAGLLMAMVAPVAAADLIGLYDLL